MKKAMIGFVLLAGCSTEALLDSAYPGWERFQFQTSDGESLMFYACEPGETDRATQRRATEAHAFFDRNLNALADRAAGSAIDRAESGQGVVGNALALNREINANINAILAQMEARYQCIIYDEQAA